MITDYHPAPLVLVEGFLSATSAVFWGKFEQFLNAHSTGKVGKKIFFTSVGPVSSLHDRACELYYELKGGRVDYGEAHAREFGHERYGRDHHEGLYPAWSVEHPLHFLGHSIGGSTITKLIALLREGFFGDDAHPDMVLSVTSVSAPFRGTQLVYTLGEKVDSAPAVRPLSVGSLISRTVHTLAYLAPLLPSLPFDLHADARRLTCRQSSFSAFVRQLWRSNWAEGRDAAPYDCTFLASDEREARGEGLPNPGTWYRSHVGVVTPPERPGTRRAPSLSSLLSPFYLPALLAGTFDFSVIRPSPSWLRIRSGVFSDRLDAAECGGREGVTEDGRDKSEDPQSTLGEEYWANDGIVPLFSQWHPLPCSPTYCTHIDTESPRPLCPPPGVWHVHLLPGAAHHVTLVPVWLGTQRQQLFWADMGAWLEQVEEGWRERRESYAEKVWC